MENLGNKFPRFLQKKEVRAAQKRLAKEWRDKAFTEKRIAELLGVARETVRNWLSMHNGQSANVHNTPDARVKLNKAAKELAVKRVQDGESQAQVAADFGVDQATVSRAVQQATKETRRRQEESAAAADLSGPDWVVTADQAVVQCQAVITDPPYGVLDEEWEPGRSGAPPNVTGCNTLPVAKCRMALRLPPRNVTGCHTFTRRQT